MGSTSPVFSHVYENYLVTYFREMECVMYGLTMTDVSRISYDLVERSNSKQIRQKHQACWEGMVFRIHEKTPRSDNKVPNFHQSRKNEHPNIHVHHNQEASANSSDFKVFKCKLRTLFQWAKRPLLGVLPHIEGGLPRRWDNTPFLTSLANCSTTNFFLR